MSEESNWLSRRVALAGAVLATASTLACAPAALADTAQVTGATASSTEAAAQPAESDAAAVGTPVTDASQVPELSDGADALLGSSGEPPALPDGQEANPRPGMDPVGAPEKRHGAVEGEELAPAVKVDPECAPSDDCVTLWVWGASMMVDPDITLRQLNAWRAQAAEKGVTDAEGNAISGEPLVWSDSLAFAAQELAVELALGGGDASTLSRLNGTGSVTAGEGNTFFSATGITGVNVSNLTSVQGALDAWYVESQAYWYGPTSTVYYLTGEYANAVSNDAKAVGMAAVMLSNQEVYIVCVFGDEAPEQVGDSTYAPTTGGAIYQGVNVLRDNLELQLVAPETLTAGAPVELGINASTTLTGNAVGRSNGVAIDSAELLSQADVQVVQDGAVVGEVEDGVLQAYEGFTSGAATLQVVMGGQVVTSADVEVVAVPEGVASTEPAEVDVPSGGTVALPDNASVRWSGGSLTDEPVAWEPLTDEQLGVVASREGGSFEVSGTVEATGETVVADVTVEPATPVSAQAPEAQQVWVGGAAVLPETVSVTWSNGDVTDEPVAWGVLDTSVAGSYEVPGTVEGLAEPVNAQVDVLELEVASVEGQAVQVSVASGSPAEGLVPADMSVASVTWSDGSVTRENIAWDAPGDDALAVLASREGGSFELAGTVGDTGVAASATVTVEPATPVSAQAPASQQVWVGGAAVLPETVAVTWSNGDVTDEPVAWGALDTSVAGTFAVEGTVGDTGLAVEAGVEVRALEVEGVGEVSGLAAQAASGSAASDVVASLPQTAPVTWSDGSVTDEPITWAEPDGAQLATLSSREGGTVEVEGTVGETGQTVTATVEVAPAVEVSAEAPQVEQDVWVGSTVELPRTVAVTWSNGDVTDEPVTWQAVDTSQAGAVEVQGTVEGLADPVVVTLEVKQPVATGVGEVSGLDVSVESGAAAADVLGSLPQTAPVTWSDGSVTDEPIAWADLDEAQLGTLSSREGGSIDVTGEVAAAGQAVSAHVEVAPATEVSTQAPEARQVWVGGEASLPETVAVTWSNGDVTDEPVTWQPVDTSQAGTVEVQGGVEGLADPVVATVEVEQPEATGLGEASGFAVTAASGAAAADAIASLPQTVSVVWSDDSVTDEPIAWAEPDADQQTVLSSREGGTVEVEGTVGETGQTVTATVEVAPATEVSAQAPETQQAWVGGEVELPQTVAVTWSNGDVTDEPVTWQPVDTSQAGTVEVQGGVEGLADPVVATVEVEQPEATGVGEVEGLAVSVDSGASVADVLGSLPQTAPVTWSDGSVTDEPITWAEPDEAQLAMLSSREGGLLEIEGTVGETGQTVTATVEVAGSTATAVELAAQDEGGIEVDPGELPELPDSAQVSWSNGETTDEAVTWDMPAADEFAAGADVGVSGTVESTGQDVEVTVHVRQAAEPEAGASDVEAPSAGATSGTDAEGTSGSATDASAAGTAAEDASGSEASSSSVAGPVADAANGSAAADSASDSTSDSATASASSNASSDSDGASGSTTGSAGDGASGSTAGSAGDSASGSASASSSASSSAGPSASAGSSPSSAASPSAPASSFSQASSQSKAGLPAWVIATLAGLGAALVAAIAIIVSKRRNAEKDDEPIGKHARR